VFRKFSHQNNTKVDSVVRHTVKKCASEARRSKGSAWWLVSSGVFVSSSASLHAIGVMYFRLRGCAWRSNLALSVVGDEAQLHYTPAPSHLKFHTHTSSLTLIEVYPHHPTTNQMCASYR
jgi:hypothetical protein